MWISLAEHNGIIAMLYENFQIANHILWHFISFQKISNTQLLQITGLHDTLFTFMPMSWIMNFRKCKQCHTIFVSIVCIHKGPPIQPTLCLISLALAKQCRHYVLWAVTGIILFMRPANERRGYIVTSSLIGWAHIQNDPYGDFTSFIDSSPPNAA